MTILLLFVAFFLGFTIGKLSKSDKDAAKADAWRIEKANMLLTIHTQADEIRHQEMALVELLAKKVNFEMESE